MWEKLKSWFHDSEVILWARLQIVLGLALEVFLQTPASAYTPFVPPNWLPFLLAAHGVFLEFIRKRRDENL